MIRQTRGNYDGFGTRELFVEGAGPEVILLHGFADSADTWRLVLAKLHQRGRAARAVDLPGCGAADRLRSGSELAQLDSFVSAVIAGNGIAGRTVLVGNSLGAALALRAGTSATTPLGAVVALAAPSAFARGLSILRAMDFALPVLSRAPVPDVVLSRSTRVALRRFLYGSSRGADLEAVERFRAQALDMRSAAALLHRANLLTSMLRSSIRPGQVTCPVTLIHGTRDAFIPLSAARQLDAALPDSLLVVLPRIGHCPQLEVPDTVARIVHRLLPAVSGAGDGRPTGQRTRRTRRD